MVGPHGLPAGPAAQPERRHCARSSPVHSALGLHVASRRVVGDADPVVARVGRLTLFGAIPIAVPVAESVPVVFAVGALPVAAATLPVAAATLPVSVSAFPVAVALAVRVVFALLVPVRVVFPVTVRVFRVGVRVVFRVGGLLMAEKKVMHCPLQEGEA